MFKEFIKNIAVELKKSQISYMIIGGQAVLVYGEPRLTKDIDITLGLGPEQVSMIQAVVDRMNLTPLVENPESFVRETMVFPVMESRSGIRVDFIFSYSEYEKEALKRTIVVRFDETDVYFASLEDVIIHKIVAGRPRDLEDVKSIILKNPNYNTEYIKTWLEEFEKSLDQNFLNVFHQTLKDSTTE